MMLLSELAHKLGAELRGADAPIVRVDAAAGAGPESIVFAGDAAALQPALESRAGAIIVSPALAEQSATPKTLMITRNPKLAFARAASLLAVERPATGVHPAAVIASGAVLGENVSVEACAVIESGVRVGAGTVIGSGAVIGEGVAVGERCHIHPRVVIYAGAVLGDRVTVHAGAVLGADGFGYVRDAATGEYTQFPQQGRLVIEDDVEIGANTTIDRGALEETRIGRGVKIDNQVHLGHNVRVGRNVVIAAQTGISGSCVIGEGAVIGGQVGMGDHVEIGPGVILGSSAGVLPHKNLRGPGMVFWGVPAKPLKQYLRELAMIGRLGKKKEGEE